MNRYMIGSTLSIIKIANVFSKWNFLFFELTTDQLWARWQTSASCRAVWVSSSAVCSKMERSMSNGKLNANAARMRSRIKKRHVYGDLYVDILVHVRLFILTKYILVGQTIEWCKL
jgi:hypothetical protein